MDGEETKWYEVIAQVHGRDAVWEAEPDLDSAISRAEDSLAFLREDMDIAFWLVAILPHWCDKETSEAFNCECWRRRGEEKPYVEVRGETIDDLGGMT